MYKVLLYDDDDNMGKAKPLILISAYLSGENT